MRVWGGVWKSERDQLKEHSQLTKLWPANHHKSTTPCNHLSRGKKHHLLLNLLSNTRAWSTLMSKIKYSPRIDSVISFLWPGVSLTSVTTWHLYRNSSAVVTLLITSVAVSWYSKCPSLLNLSVILPALCGLNLVAKSSGRLMLLFSLCIFICPIVSPPLAVYSHSRATLVLLWPTTTTVGSSGVLVKENAESDV